MYNRPLKQSRQRCNTIIGWVAVIFDVAILWVNYENLRYNRMNAYQSARIANELSALNRSKLICDVREKLREEKSNGT